MVKDEQIKKKKVWVREEPLSFSSTKKHREMRRGIRRFQEKDVTTKIGQQRNADINKESGFIEGLLGPSDIRKQNKQNKTKGIIRGIYEGMDKKHMETSRHTTEKEVETASSLRVIDEENKEKYEMETLGMVAEATNYNKEILIDTARKMGIKTEAVENIIKKQGYEKKKPSVIPKRPPVHKYTKKEIRKMDKQRRRKEGIKYWQHVFHPPPQKLIPYQSVSKYYYQNKKMEKTWAEIIKETAEKNSIVMGESTSKKPECIRTMDMYKHILIDGKTGTGKTVLSSQMILQHIIKGDNVFVMSPHPDLIYQRVLSHLPKSIADNIIIINPADPEMPIRFNLFDIPNRETLEQEGNYAQLEKMKEIVITNLFNMFKRMWGTWGPLLEKNLTYAFQAALSIPNTTMIDVHWILTNWEKRYRMINMLEREELRDFFLYEMKEMQYEDISSARVRIGKFAMSDTLKATLCCRDNPIHMTDLVQPGKIVLIDLNEKNLGVENMRILGIIFITQLWMAIIARKGYDIMDEKQNRGDTNFPTFLFVDEFQNFASGSFQDMLSEARKYQFGIVMATQYLKQVDQDMRDSIIANVGTPISFFVGVDDAEIMSRWLGCKESFLTDMDPYQYITRTTVGNKTTRWYWGSTYPPAGKPLGWLEKVKDFALISRQIYGRPYDPANTSLFGGDVQETQDLLLAMYSLTLETHTDTFDGLRLHSKLEEISHLPGLVKDYVMSKLLNTAVSMGYIEINSEKTPDKILKKLEAKNGWKENWDKIFYKMTMDGEITLGVRETSSMGRGGQVGSDKHKNLLMRMLRHMAERSVKLRMVHQGGSSTKPDAEIFVMPNKAGRRATDIQKIEDAIKNSWIYQQTKGRDVNVEAESTTLQNPPKVHRNLAKGIAQERIVFFAVENNEDAYCIYDILEELVEKGYKDYSIDADKGFRDNYFAHKPSHNDYKIFIVGGKDQSLKEMDRKGRICVVETLASMEITSESYEIWKTLHPILQDMLKKEKTDIKKISINELFEKGPKEVPNFTLEGTAESLRQTGILTKEIERAYDNKTRNFVVDITSKDLCKIEVTLKGMELHRDENKKILEEENKTILHCVQLLRKKMGKSEKVMFENTGDIARKLNVSKYVVNKLLRRINVEPNTLDGRVTVKQSDIPKQTVLEYLMGVVDEDTVKGVTVDELVDVLGMDRKEEITGFLEGQGFEEKTVNNKIYYRVDGGMLRKILTEEEKYIVKEEKKEDVMVVDLSKMGFMDYCKQLPGSPVDVLPLGFEKLENDIGKDRLEEFLGWCKDQGFKIDENKKQVWVDKSILHWEEKTETEKQPPMGEVAGATNKPEESMEGLTNKDKILKVLSANKDKLFTIKEISELTKMDYNVAGKTLSRLKDEGLVVSPNRGEYCYKKQEEQPE